MKQYLSFLAGERKIIFFNNDFLHANVVDKYRDMLIQKLNNNNGIILFSEYKELIGGTKRFRSLLLDIIEAEKLIELKKGENIDSETDTSIALTHLGKHLANKRQF